MLCTTLALWMKEGNAVRTRVVYHSPMSAGLDLKSAYEYYINPGGKCLVKTDFQLIFPPYCYGRIAPRTGKAYRHHISVGAGVIDPDYKGPISILLFNHKQKKILHQTRRSNSADRLGKICQCPSPR